MRSMSFVFIFLACNASAATCNVAARETYLNTCELRKMGFRGSAGLTDLAEDDLGMTCETEYDKRVRHCETLKAENAKANREGIPASATSAAGNSTPKATAAGSPSSSTKINAQDTAGKAPAKQQDFSSTREEHQSGAENTNEDLTEVETAKSQIQKMGLKSATAAKKVATANQKQNSGASQLTKQKLRADSDLADQAKSAINANEEFTKQQAEKATDAKVKKHLLAVSAATEAKPVLAKEEDRLTNQLAKFLELAKSALERNRAMEAAEGSRAVFSDPRSEPQKSIEREVDDQSGRNTSSLSSDSGKSASAESENAGAATEKSARGESAKSAQTAKELAKKESLRATLRAQLAKLVGGSEHSLEGINASDHFGGELTPESSGTIAQVAPIPNDDQLKAFLTSSYEEAERKPAMDLGHAEVDSFLNEGIGRTDQSGILSVESTSLFERVHIAHRTCLKKKCVSREAFSAPAGANG